MTTIVITLTIKEPKGKGRPVIVSAAPAGEMPLLLAGQFADRHALADQAFATLLSRKPQTVKVAAEKVAKKKSPAAGKVAESEEPAEESGAPEAPAPAPEDKPDQLVRPEELPAIEGDETGEESEE